MTGIALAVLLMYSATKPAPPTYWGSLTPGPHPVGFTQRWIIDSTRRLSGGDSIGLRFRPILLNVWYPAVARPVAPMRYHDYFDGALRAAKGRRGLDRYASALIAYERKVSRSELLGDGSDTIPALQQRYGELLAAATIARRDVPMQRGRLPVVVYTSGSRSSYDENVVLCEYLASRGILVVGSAYPQEDNSDFTTSASDESRQRDIRRLLLEIGRLPGVQPSATVAIGHSAGAQALLLFAADPTAPVDAVLSFDTTQDYARLNDRSWAYFTDRVVERRKHIRMPIMFVASPEALFELGDSLSATQRWFVSVPDLSHNDYLSQGILRRELARGRPGNDSTRAIRARRSYSALVTYTEAWISWFAAGSRRGDEPAAPAPLAFAYAAPGTQGPVSGASGVPSAREMRHIYSSEPDSAFATAFIQARNAKAPSGGDQVLLMLLAGALAEGRRDQARAAYGVLVARDSTVRRVMDAMVGRAQLFDQIQALDLARKWWEYVAILDPSAEIPAKYRR